MIIAMGCDPNAQAYTEEMMDYVRSLGHEVVDFGSDDVIYAHVATQVGEAVAAKKCDRGILFCGTGAGVAVVANKHKGIYCVPCESAFTAFKAAQINNANVISMGANVVGSGNACKIVDSYLESSFAIGGDENRVAFLSGLLDQLYEVENKNFK